MRIARYKFSTLTANEAATCFKPRISTRAIAKAAKDGQIPARKVGRRFFFNPQFFDGYRPVYPPAKKQIVTYFIQAGSGGLIKIGKTNDLMNRIRVLQLGCPAKVICLGWIAGNVESELHEKFRAFRQHAEWFSPAQSIIRYIQKHAA